MKKIILFIVSCFLINTASAQTPDIHRGLEYFYPFNHGYSNLDFSQNGYNLFCKKNTYTGNCGLFYAKGHYGKYNGGVNINTSGYVYYNQMLDFLKLREGEKLTNSDEFTFNVWVYIKDFDNHDQYNLNLFSHAHTRKEYSITYDMLDISLAFKLDGSNKLVYSMLVDTNSNQAYYDQEVELGKDIKGHWMQVTFVKNINNAWVYINGEQVSHTYYDLGTPKVNWNKLLLLSSHKYHNGKFDCDLDDLRIYTRAITPSEVKMLYNLTEDDVQPNKVQGTVFIEGTNGCEYEEENGLGGMVVSASPGNRYTVTNDKGEYTLYFAPVANEFIISHQVDFSAPYMIGMACPADKVYKVSFDSNASTVLTDRDFVIKTKKCPFVTVDIKSTARRRCFPNKTYVEYCNKGSVTAKNAKVVVSFPNEIELMSATESYKKLPNNKYEFSVGDIKPNNCKTIQIIDSVICGDESFLNRTVCTKAEINFDNMDKSCGFDPTLWDGTDVGITAECVGDTTAKFILRSLRNEIRISRKYSIYADDEMIYTNNYKLHKNDSIVIEVPTANKNIRLELEEDENNPHGPIDIATVNNCFMIAPPEAKKANFFPDNKTKPITDEDCMTIRGSYDPNDKTAIPGGVTSRNVVKPGVPLNYVIRFQNTGNDTAFNIIVVDTLQEYLDMATFKAGVSSHKYTLKVSGEGKTVLNFHFNNIQLPDSFTNEPASNGFLTFSIMPNKDILLGTKLENFADIYFDYNSPIRTNTTLTTIDILPSINWNATGDIKVNGKVVDGLKLQEGTFIMYPNPAHEVITFELSGLSEGQKISYSLTNAVGKKCATRIFKAEGEHMRESINLTNLNAGVYILTVLVNGQTIVQKVVVQ